jgi:hypothetical protein
MTSLRESVVIASGIALAGLFIGLGVGTGLAFRHEFAIPRTAHYQMFADTYRTFVVDTETGQIWDLPQSGPYEPEFFHPKTKRNAASTR